MLAGLADSLCVKQSQCLLRIKQTSLLCWFQRIIKESTKVFCPLILFIFSSYNKSTYSKLYDLNFKLILLKIPFVCTLLLSPSSSRLGLNIFNVATPVRVWLAVHCFLLEVSFETRLPLMHLGSCVPQCYLYTIITEGCDYAKRESVRR